MVNPEIFELFGIYVGDGCISINKRYKELAILGDIEEEYEYYTEHIIPLLNKNISVPLTGKHIKGKYCKTMGVYGIITFDKKIVDYFIQFGFKSGPKTKIKLPKKITNSSKKLKASFIRGLFDTDGSIYFEKNYSAKSSLHKRPKIKITTVSENLKNQILIMLKEFGMEPMETRPYKGKRDKNPNFGLILYKKKDIMYFINNIGFNSTKHKTKISVWKKFGYCPPKTKIIERKALLNINR